MEAFPVICETCRAKLRVNDPQIVGQIHACPKCDSMVHLVPPAGWATPTPAAETLDSGPASPATGSDPTTHSSEVSMANPRVEATGHFKDVESPELNCPLGAESTTLREPAVPSETTPASAPAPAMAGVSQVEVFWQQVAVWGVGGVSLFVIGGIVGALWMLSGHNPAGSANDRRAVAANDVPEAPTAEPPADSAVNSDVEKVPEDLPNDALVESEPRNVEVTAARPQLPADAVPVDRIVTINPEVSDALSEPTSSTESAADSDKALSESSPRRTFDLLSLDPQHLDLATGLGGSEDSLESVSPRAMLDPIERPHDPPTDAESVGASTPLAEGNSQFEDVRAAVVDAGQPLSAPADVLAPLRRGPVPSPPARPRNVSSQLDLPVDSIHLSGIPLARWLDFIARMIDVPITLTPDALRMAGIAPDALVTVRSETTTAGTLLANVLAEYRLTILDRSGQLAIVFKGQQRRRSVDYGVSDLLAPHDADATPIAKLVQQLVRPESWESQGGSGRLEVLDRSIRVRHEQGIQIEVLVLLERLLLARDQPTKSRYPVERLSIEPTYSRLAGQLDRRTTFTLLAWTELAEVFRYWQQELGLTILVDWASLADVQLEPKSPVACSIQDRPWEVALDTVLEPLELTWQAVDKNTIEITSRATATATQRLEFYPVADLVRHKFAGADVLIREITNQLRDQLASAVVDQTEIVFDHVSNYLLVLAPADAQRLITRQLSAM